MANIPISGHSMTMLEGYLRANPRPLDASSVHADYASAAAYAATDPTAYVGQILNVLSGDNNHPAGLYCIENTDGDLISLSKPYIHGDQIEIDGDGFDQMMQTTGLTLEQLYNNIPTTNIHDLKDYCEGVYVDGDHIIFTPDINVLALWGHDNYRCIFFTDSQIKTINITDVAEAKLNFWLVFSPKSDVVKLTTGGLVPVVLGLPFGNVNDELSVDCPATVMLHIQTTHSRILISKSDMWGNMVNYSVYNLTE